jgi:hypothetical protein
VVLYCANKLSVAAAGYTRSKTTLLPNWATVVQAGIILLETYKVTIVAVNLHGRMLART